MSRYVIVASGCDDSTYAVVDLTPDQAEGVAKVAAATVERSQAGCQPTLKITPYDAAPAYDRESAEESHDDEH